MNFVERSAIRRPVRSFAAGHSGHIGKPRQRVGAQSSGERLRPSGEGRGRAIDAGNCCASNSATRTEYFRAYAVILILVASAFLGGCGPVVPAKESTATFYSVGPYVAYEFRLEDGTRCVLSAGSGTGIDCDFSGERQ